jgi:hypothetical protein
MGHLLVLFLVIGRGLKIAVNAVVRNEAVTIFFRHGIIAE